MRIRLTSEWSCLVQCFVVASFRWSASDQMLRNGLCVTNGTAGGRKSAPAAIETLTVRSAETSKPKGVFQVLVIFRETFVGVVAGHCNRCTSGLATTPRSHG